MNSILQLFDLLETRIALSDFILKIGSIKKKVGNRYFITPKDNDFQAISVMSKNDNIDWVGVILARPISISSIIEIYGFSFEKKYNHYDEETILTFRIENNTYLNCYLDGYINYDKIVEMKFNRLRISITSQTLS